MDIWIIQKGRCEMSNTNMATGKKSRGAGCLRWLGRVVLGGLVLIAGLAAIGAIYQAVASARDAKAYKPIDQMVDVNGIQMRLDCRGNGSPTVVLEAGAGSSSIYWALIQDDVAEFTRVCSYDRAGMGWSDSVRGELSPRQVAGMLHDLLEKGGVQPPYLMAGHSLGGVYVRAFAAEYPEDVVGMVLVDSSHESQNQKVPPEFEKLSKAQTASLQFFRIAAPLGVVRAFKMLDAGIASLPLAEEEKGSLLAEMYRTSYWGASAREANMFVAYSSQPRELNSLGDMPLIVLSEEMNGRKLYQQIPPAYQSQITLEMMERQAEDFNRMQDELTALSTRGKRIVVGESGHFIQLDAPRVVIDAIRDVFEQVSR